MQNTQTAISQTLHKFLQFTDAVTYCKYNFTLAPDPQGWVTKYKETFREIGLDTFKEEVPVMFENILKKYFKQFFLVMTFELGKGGVRHYHGQIVSTEPALSELYLNDLIANIAFKFTSRYRNNKVKESHPCIRIYSDGKYKDTEIYKSKDYENYIDYMFKESKDYYINTTYLSKHYSDKWAKYKSILIQVKYSHINCFIDETKLAVKKANVNIPKLRKAYQNKQNQQLETLLALKTMFKHVKIDVNIDTSQLDEILDIEANHEEYYNERFLEAERESEMRPYIF